MGVHIVPRTLLSRIANRLRDGSIKKVARLPLAHAIPSNWKADRDTGLLALQLEPLKATGAV